MAMSSLLFEAFTGLAGLLACAFLISAFISEPPPEQNRVEWTLRRRAK
jgi:hypothetical protein